MKCLLLFLFSIIFILILLLHYLHIEKFVPEYLNHKSSCFDCEKEVIRRCGEDSVWRANPSKMFSTEKAGVNMYGEAGGFIGKTMKYY